MPADTLTAAAPAPRTTAPRRVGAVVRRVPFTLAVVTTMLVLGVATEALWSPFEDSALFDDVAFGAPALEAGRWWTPVTGSFFALEPWQYLPVAGGFLLLVGFAETRLGTRRTATVTATAQLAGVVGASLLLTLLAGTGWDWAERTADVLDVGFSAGVVGATTVAVTTLRSPWRLRLGAIVAAYVLVSVVYFGALADVEHLIGWLTGLALVLALTPAALHRGARSTRHQVARLQAAGFFGLSALVTVLGALDAGTTGPLGRITGRPLWVVGVDVVLDVTVALGLLRGRRGWWWVAVVLAGLGAVVSAVTVVAGMFGSDEANLPLFVVALLLDGGALALLVVRRAAFRNRGRSRVVGTGTSIDREAARAAVARLGAGDQRLAWMTTWRGNALWAPGDPEGFVAHQVHAGVAVAVADPVGADAADRARLARGFVAECRTAGLVPAFFSCSPELADLGRELGWSVVQVAEEAVIDLPDLEFRGKRWQDVRTAINQAAKQGIEHRLVTLAHEPPEIQDQVRAISAAWLGDSGLPEMAFTLGGVEEAMDPAVRTGLAIDAEGRVHGVTSWLPVHAPGGTPTGWTLDVMRRAPDSFRYTMELLIASACLAFQEEGCLTASLSGSPLARSEGAGPPTGIDAVLDRLAGTLEPLYGFASLHHFKMKFQPRAVPLSLVTPDVAALPVVGLAIVRCYLPEARADDLVGALRSMRS